MAHRSTDAYGGTTASRLVSPWKVRWRYALALLCAAGTVGYPVALHYWLPEAPAVGQRLLALGFVVLAVTTYVLVTQPRGLLAELFQLLRRGRQGWSERQSPRRRRLGQRMIPIPGLGEISLRLSGGAAVLLIAGGWWLTPWTPVRMKPPLLGDVTGMLAEDLVAMMLVLPNDHMAVVQLPEVPPRLRSQTRWIREDAYPLAMRCLAAEDFAAARAQLARAAELQELDALDAQVLGAQVEMYACRFPEAIRAYSGALKQKPDDPMLWCQLAAAWIQSGEFDSARQPVETAVRLCRERGGQAQPAMAACRHLQGLLAMARCKDFDQAVEMIEDARESCKKAVGEDHVLVAASLNNQAVLYVLRANYPAARELLDFSLAIGTKAVGAGDAHVTAVRCNLAVLSYCQGQYAQAAELLAQAAPRAAEAAVQSDAARLAGLNLQAVLCRAMGRPATDDKSDPALATIEEAQSIAQKTLQPDHPWAAVLADSLADVYADHAQYAKAYQQALDAERMTRKAWGPEHPFMAEQLNHLAAIRTLQHEYAEADTLCQQAQKIAERAYDKRHPAVADVLLTRGRLEIAQKKFAEAKEYLDRALKIQGTTLGPDHPDLAATLTAYAEVLDKLAPADPKRAAEVRARTAEMRAQAAEILAKQQPGDQ
jgi:Flp pilus assembly protein TadD